MDLWKKPGCRETVLNDGTKGGGRDRVQYDTLGRNNKYMYYKVNGC